MWAAALKLPLSCAVPGTSQMVPYKIIKASNGDAWVEVRLAGNLGWHDVADIC
jgi:hypothetical protein